MNDVQIDEVRLTAEADAAIAAAPLDQVAGESGQVVAAPPESWAPLVESMTPALRLMVFPQWGITDAEAKEFSDSLGQCLDQVFPGGLAGPYACWCRLILCGGGIVAMRVMQTGKIPPLGPRRAVQKDKATAGSETSAAQ